MTSTLAKLRKPFDEADMIAIDEAQRMLDRVKTWADREQEEIERLRPIDATVCALRLQRMNSWLKGDELAEPFVTLSEELDEDKEFQAQLKAEGALRSLRAEANKMAFAKDPFAAKSNKSNTSRIKKIYKTLNDIIEELPNTPAAETAAAMKRSYELD